MIGEDVVGPAVRIPEIRVDGRLHPDRHVLAWTVRGNASLVCGHGPDAVTYRLAAGQLLWIPAGVPHSVTVHADSTLFPLHFPAAETATVLRDPTVLAVDRDTEVLCLALLQAAVTVIRPPFDLRRKVLAILESEFVSPFPGLTMPISPAARAMAHALLVDPGDERTVREWAEALHVGERSLVRAFPRETGLTIKRWRRRCRMEAARRLLRSGVTVAAVGHRVGYADQAAFGRAFRAEFGVPPHRHRRDALP